MNETMNSTDRLFGTDGIRGRANYYPVTSEMAVKVGRAVALHFRTNNENVILIGTDTRLSGDMLVSAVASGVCSTGTDAMLGGVMPTAGVAYGVFSGDPVAGIVITASHNPFHDNGFKVFNGDGFKLNDSAERLIENHILETGDGSVPGTISEPGRIIRNEAGNKRYFDFLQSIAGSNQPFRGLKIVLDCSNGSCCEIAPSLFDGLGAHVETIFNNPDGRNINANCGSEYPELMAHKVRETGSHMGLAFDGDADRIIAADESGKLLTGDQIIAICAGYLKENNKLLNNIVVSTVMSNMGLEVALKDRGINHMTSRVGDRHVMEKMLEQGAVLGGEDSGHIIFSEYQTTGDGMLTGIQLIRAMLEKKSTLSALAEVMKVFPQNLINVEVRSKPEIDSNKKIMESIKKAEIKLGPTGRVLVRYSGTQAICRVMVEGATLDETEKHCQHIADTIKAELG